MKYFVNAFHHGWHFVINRCVLRLLWPKAEYFWFIWFVVFSQCVSVFLWHWWKKDEFVIQIPWNFVPTATWGGNSPGSKNLPLSSFFFFTKCSTSFVAVAADSAVTNVLSTRNWQIIERWQIKSLLISLCICKNCKEIKLPEDYTWRWHVGLWCEKLCAQGAQPFSPFLCSLMHIEMAYIINTGWVVFAH